MIHLKTFAVKEGLGDNLIVSIDDNGDIAFLTDTDIEVAYFRLTSNTLDEIHRLYHEKKQV